MNSLGMSHHEADTTTVQLLFGNQCSWQSQPIIGGSQLDDLRDDDDQSWETIQLVALWSLLFVGYVMMDSWMRRIQQQQQSQSPLNSHQQQKAEEEETKPPTTDLVHKASTLNPLLLATQTNTTQNDEATNVRHVYKGRLLDRVFGNSNRLPQHVTHATVHPAVFEIPFLCCFHHKLLTSIIIPKTVRIIGDYAFSGCISLKEVAFHHPHGISLTKIGAWAFSDCPSLTELELPTGLVEIGEGAFASTKSCDDDDEEEEEMDGHPSNETASLLLRDVSLPEGLKRIGRSAFYGARLGAVALPGTLEEIGISAFEKSQILSVSIPPATIRKVKIGKWAFAKCQSLVTVSVPDSVTLDDQAFAECHLLNTKGNKQQQLLRNRFENLPVHEACYHSNTVEELEQAIEGESGHDVMVPKDALGMTPFHILATTADLRQDVLECLLERYPTQVVYCKDVHGTTMLDYLLQNRSKKAVPLIQMVLQRVLVDRLLSAKNNDLEEFLLKTKLETIVESFQIDDEMETRRDRVHALFKRAEWFTSREVTCLMDLALWKMKMKDAKRTDADSRETCRHCNGGEDVIQNVMEFFCEKDDDDDDEFTRMSATSTLFPLLCHARLAS